MRIVLLAVGKRLPAWVNSGYEEYARRLPPECELRLTEIPTAKRIKGMETGRIVAQEGERMLAAIPQHARVLALDQTGRVWNTRQIAAMLDNWLHQGRDTALLVGGPDGLAPACQARAEERWSLSPLTLPHALVRIVVAEQLYRAWSMLKNHPYHR